jgi:hypothetical protein
VITGTGTVAQPEAGIPLLVALAMPVAGTALPVQLEVPVAPGTAIIALAACSEAVHRQSDSVPGPCHSGWQWHWHDSVGLFVLVVVA